MLLFDTITQFVIKADLSETKMQQMYMFAKTEKNYPLT